MRRSPAFLMPFFALALPSLLRADPPVAWADAVTDLEAYFESQTAALADTCLEEVQSAEDWKRLQPVYRQQLREMLGLDPWPERSPLHATVTGRIEHEEILVENLHFQSMPQLYVTANLYLPKHLEKPAPAILYVCGHGGVKENGVSLGNKTHYQHHGAWFARHGYVCLTIDTIQLGEIEGLHHGTYRETMWWWNARGYTPAGVEAWNGVRALDYLQGRPEVDADRIGMTGRSGGGVYTWWVAAIDERVKAAVPVAGITTLENHVVDGCVEGHCDCMYHVNTYRWDFPQIAALVAPRPLLISNSDKDNIFPLDGVVELHRKVRRVYELLGAGDKLGLQITEGPHQDTQNLRIHAFDWFNRFLKSEQELIDTPAVSLFEKRDLRVFGELPSDERTSQTHEFFVPQASPRVPDSQADWERMREAWMTALKTKVFNGWPRESVSLDLSSVDSSATTFRFVSQPHVVLPLQALDEADGNKTERIVLYLRRIMADDISEAPFPDSESTTAVYATAPRGAGPTGWTDDEREFTHIRRRFMLLGQTLDGMRVWDVTRAVAAAREHAGVDATVPVTLRAEGEDAAIALYASLFAENVDRLELESLPLSHADGPIFLNVLKVLDIPQALALVLDRKIDVALRNTDPEVATFARQTQNRLAWEDQLTLTP